MSDRRGRIALLRAAAALAVATAGLGPAPGGAAAAGAPALVLSGRGAAYADVTLPRAVRVLPMRLLANGESDGWSWKGCGRVRGFYLRPMKGDPMSGAGAVEFADLHYGDPTSIPGAPGGRIPRLPVPLGATALGQQRMQPFPVNAPITLPAGRYRAYLLGGDGACQVRVPLPGLRGTVRVTAGRAARMQFGTGPLDVAAPVAGVPAPRAGTSAFPVTVGPRTFAFSLTHWVYYTGPVPAPVPAQVSVYDQCVEKFPGSVCEPTRFGDVRYPTAGPPTRSALYYRSAFGSPYWLEAGDVLAVPVVIPDATHFATWYAPGWLAPGEHLAKATTAVTGTVSHVQAAMFALDL